MKAVDSKAIRERLTALRGKMKERGIDAYLVVTDDFHASEYVGDYFKCREYISGFDGSAGSVVVLPEEAGLWTDGRYFLQAAEQLKDTGITLFKMAEKDVPELESFLKEKLGDGAVLGFDGRTVSSKLYQKLRKELGDGVRIEMDMDLAGEIWENRPAMSAEPVYELDVQFAGKTRAEKLSELREALEEKKLDGTVIATLDDIAWLLNLRGNDVLYNPVFLSYLIVLRDKAVLYANIAAISDEIKTKLKNNDIELCPYNQFYSDLETVTAKKKILVDPAKVNAAIIHRMPASTELVEAQNLTERPKAIKNETEIRNEAEAHIRDGVAVTRFIYWLKQHVGKETITERSAAEKLESFRSEGKNYCGQSFAPISGYAEHGAIVHYEATEATDVEIRPESFLLLDTGGQYLEGTTDITRTIALGALSQEQKTYYTAVLRGNLNLAAAKFKHGCIGANLDLLARQPLWEMDLDYNHGTGHGVGYFLNVHEGPQTIRYKVNGDPENLVLEPGMITSDEPGLYLTGKYGIRIENLMVCVERSENEYGQFLGFDTLTMVPYETDAIDVSQLNEGEKSLLNEYNAEVFDKISPFLNEEERNWLANVTKAV